MIVTISDNCWTSSNEKDCHIRFTYLSLSVTFCHFQSLSVAFCYFPVSLIRVSHFQSLFLSLFWTFCHPSWVHLECLLSTCCKLSDLQEEISVTFQQYHFAVTLHHVFVTFCRFVAFCYQWINFWEVLPACSSTRYHDAMVSWIQISFLQNLYWKYPKSLLKIAMLTFYHFCSLFITFCHFFLLVNQRLGGVTGMFCAHQCPSKASCHDEQQVAVTVCVKNKSNGFGHFQASAKWQPCYHFCKNKTQSDSSWRSSKKWRGACPGPWSDKNSAPDIPSQQAAKHSLQTFRPIFKKVEPHFTISYKSVRYRQWKSLVIAWTCLIMSISEDFSVTFDHFWDSDTK